MKSVWKPADQILDELGVKNAEDIDVEAIAQYVGATVTYEFLAGCEANIIGHADRAIITVNASSRRPRQRFGIAHELGHWMYDHGTTVFACQDVQFQAQWSDAHPEARANRYASDLLLPDFLFRPLAHGRPCTLSTVRDLANQFETSLTSTAIRLVDHGSYPAMLVCNTRDRRKWFIRSSDLSQRLWPVDSPGKDTIAHDLLQDPVADAPPIDTNASEWIDHPDAGKYLIHEESFPVADGIVLSLLSWKDEQQLIDLDEADERIEGRRADGEKDW